MLLIPLKPHHQLQIIGRGPIAFSVWSQIILKPSVSPLHFTL
jgi:hypothetical protein